MPILPLQNSEITLTFTAAELLQLEAIAALHGVSVSAFVQSAALEAAHITPINKDAPAGDALWMNESSAENSAKEVMPDLFAPAEVREELPIAQASPSVKRGVPGEPSRLAKGYGPVWEIRRALGEQRVHGLGWTREHLAFVLKLSVVGIRKMEHLGTAPVKSVEARRSLLDLAKLLENPSPEIAAYIETETALLN